MNAKLTVGFLFVFPVWLLAAVTPVFSQPWRILGDSPATFPLDAVALSPDGKFLLAADFAGKAKRVLILDAANGQRIRELDGTEHFANSFAFSPDSKLVYSGYCPPGVGYVAPHRTVFVWELSSGKKLKEFQADNLALSANGKVLLLVENHPGSGPIDRGFFKDGLQEKFVPPSSVLRFVDTTSWKDLGQISMGLISALAISADGKTAAWAVVSDNEIHLVDVQSRKEIRKIQFPRPDSEFAKLHGFNVAFLAFAPDGKTLASVIDAKKVSKFGNFEGTIHLWDSQTGKEFKQMEGPDMPVRGLAYTPKGDKLIVTGPGRHWTLFSMPDGNVLEKTRGTLGHGDIVLSLYRQGTIPTAKSTPFLSYVWDLALGKDIESGDTPEGLFCLAPLPDGKTVATGDRGGILRFWDLESGKEIRRIHDANPKLRKSDTAIYSLAYSPTDKCLVSLLVKGDLKFSSAEDGKLQHVIPGARLSFAVARDGKIAAAAQDANGGFVRIWPNRAAKPDVVRLQPGGTIGTMQFSEDGKLLIVASWNGAHLIDVPGLKVLRVMEPTKRFNCAVLSPDGETAATHIQFEAGIRLWHLESGKEMGKIAVNPPPEGILHFSPDGRSLLVQHKADILLWEVASGQVRFSAPGTYSQGFSPNGRLIFSIAWQLWSIDNKQVFVWDLTGEQTGGILKPVKHAPQAQADLWADLESKADAGKAYRAMWRLAADPEQTVPFLTKKVAVIEPIDPKVTKLYDHPSPPEKILAYRIVELLEQIGTPDAQRLLETLGASAKPQFTDAARQALARLRGN